MFGGKRNKNESLSQVMMPENAPNKSSNSGGGSSLTGFDPEGLERAAKAARELDNSRNANAAIELIKSQELTKQHEHAAKRAEMDAATQQMRAMNIEKEGEEARKTLEAQTQHERHRAEYSDELERKRQVDMLNAQKYMQEEQLKKQEEMVRRQEMERRKTAELEAELRTKTELAKVEAEANGKIRQERANHDLILEKLKLEAKEYRETLLQGVKDAGEMIGSGLKSYIESPQQLANTAYTITGIAVGIYSAKVGVSLLGNWMERQLGKPSLVRETSRFTWNTKDLWARMTTPKKNLDDALKGVVLEESLSEQLRNIAVSTANTKRNKAPFRHLLLHGPPGTGKTLFAKNLAKHSGLEYAIFTGGDIAPLGRDAVTELHKLFDWAKSSRKGLLLFVDEADAFLQSRERNAVNMSEDQRNALNAFLYRTGTETNKFMMVYASNQPSQFDEAITDRIDEMVEFGLPDTNERRRMIAMYMERYLLQPSTTKRVPMAEDITEDTIESVVERTAGFSGRAISKLVIAWQAAAYGSVDGALSKDMFLTTLEHHKKNMRTKEEWARAMTTSK